MQRPLQLLALLKSKVKRVNKNSPFVELALPYTEKN